MTNIQITDEQSRGYSPDKTSRHSSLKKKQPVDSYTWYEFEDATTGHHEHSGFLKDVSNRSHSGKKSRRNRSPHQKSRT